MLTAIGLDPSQRRGTFESVYGRTDRARNLPVFDSAPLAYNGIVSIGGRNRGGWGAREVSKQLEGEPDCNG